MYSQDNWLRYGLFYSEADYRRLQRIKLIKATLALVILCSSILGAIEGQQWVSKVINRYQLFPFYQSVVISAMNGDARFSIGGELFECKGGYLGVAQ